MSTSTQALRAVATGQTAPKAKTLFDYLENPRFKTGLGHVAGRFLTPERMLSLCINAVKKTPRLRECDPQTVLGAMMASAALGLEPNTVQQQAFMIPYKKRAKVGQQWVDVYDCQFQVGARGFITLGYRSPHIASMIAGAIHEHDKFEQQSGSQTFLTHSVNLRGRGELIGAFSHVRLAEGGETACVLPLDEIWKIRSRSETFRTLTRNLEMAENDKEREKAQRALDETPWQMWVDDMASKSATKKHAKQLPIAAGDTMVTAAELDSRADAGTLDLAAMADPDVARAVVTDEIEPPALTDDPAPSMEAFGTTTRNQQQEPQLAAATPAPARGERATRSRPAPPPSPAGGERSTRPASMADAYIERIDNAPGRREAEAVLAAATDAGMQDADLKQVQQAFDMAWPLQP